MTPGWFVVVEELAITASGMTGRMELVTAGVAAANWEDSVWQPATAARVASASASGASRARRRPRD